MIANKTENTAEKIIAVKKQEVKIHMNLIDFMIEEMREKKKKEKQSVDKLMTECKN